MKEKIKKNRQIVFEKETNTVRRERSKTNTGNTGTLRAAQSLNTHTAFRKSQYSEIAAAVSLKHLARLKHFKMYLTYATHTSTTTARLLLQTISESHHAKVMTLQPPKKLFVFAHPAFSPLSLSSPHSLHTSSR